MPNLHVGDYATVTNALGQRVWTGIVYEDGTLPKSGGTPRIQLADGHKVKEIPPDSLSPATESEIAAFKATATEGMTPEAIIKREGGEHKPKAAPKHHQKHHPTGHNPFAKPTPQVPDPDDEPGWKPGQPLGALGAPGTNHPEPEPEDEED